MSSIPFLRLPLFVQLLILGNLQLDELIDVSLLSSSTKSIVTRLKYRISSLKWLIGHNRKLEIELSAPNRLIWINIPIEHNPPDGAWHFDIFPLKIYHIKPPNFDWSRTNYEFCTYKIGRRDSSENDVLASFDEISSHFLEVFKCDNFKLVLWKPLKNMFIWRHSRKFESVNIDASGMDLKDIDFILSNLSIDTLKVIGKRSQRFSGRVQASSFNTVFPLEWMTSEAFQNVESREILLDNSYISFSSLAGFLNHWKEGSGWRNLEYFHMLQEQETLEIDLKRDLDLAGIQTFSWNQSGLPKRWSGFGGRDFHFSKGRGIRRCDGRLGVLIYKTENELQLIRFMVWKEDLKSPVLSLEWEM